MFFFGMRMSFEKCETGEMHLNKEERNYYGGGFILQLKRKEKSTNKKSFVMEFVHLENAINEFLELLKRGERRKNEI